MDILELQAIVGLLMKYPIYKFIWPMMPFKNIRLIMGNMNLVIN